MVMGLCKGKDLVVRPGTREFRVGWDGYINSKIGGGFCGRRRKGRLDERKSDISRASGGQGGDAAMRFSFHSAFGVGEASNGAEVVADNPEGVTDMVVECGLHVFAAEEVVTTSWTLMETTSSAANT